MALRAESPRPFRLGDHVLNQRRFLSTLILVIALSMTVTIAPAGASVPAPGSGDPGHSTSEQAENEAEAAAAPLVWWLVVVAVNGARTARIAAKARSAARAKKIAEAVARSGGYTDVDAKVALEGDYRTAGDFQIEVNGEVLKKHGFRTFARFKKRWGEAGEGREWHHIVEQKARDSDNELFVGWKLHNRMNLINIRRGLHRRCINALMSTKLKNLLKEDRAALRITVVKKNREKTLRQTQKKYSFANQHLFGLRLLDHCGVRIDGAGI